MLRRKLSALFLVALLALGAVACASDDGVETETEGAEVEASDTEAASSEEADETEAGDDDETEAEESES